MLQLAILACMFTVRTDCIEVHLTAPDNVTPNQCMALAQPQIARWYAENPQLSRARFIKKWRCVRVGHAAFPELGRDI